MRPPTDQELGELVRLVDQAKLIAERIDHLRDLCRFRGSHCTENFVVAVIFQERTGIAPLKEVAAAVTMEVLERYGLIRESRYSIVKVTPIDK